MHELDFEAPHALDRYSFELTEKQANKKKTELHDILKVHRINIPDARDVDLLMATPLLHGRVIFFQDERIPRYFVDDQDRINAKTRGRSSLQDTTSMHLTAINGTSFMIRKILIILPPGWVTYEMKDGVMNMARQETTFPGTRFFSKVFEHDGEEVKHEYWFGWYQFLVRKVESNRKLLSEEKEPAHGLAAALARGEINF